MGDLNCKKSERQNHRNKKKTKKDYSQSTLIIYIH